MTHAEGLQGRDISRQDGEDALNKAMAMAVEYRGDVTIETSSGDVIECFVFACESGDMRFMPHAGGRQRIACADVERVTFSGIDTAAGISFDRWIERYVQRTIAGEDASLHGDPD